jgi:hypothetical protein
MPGGRIETDKLELVTRTKAEFASATELDDRLPWFVRESK